MWGKLGAVWLLCGIGSVSVAIVGEEMGNELVVRVAFLSTMFFWLTGFVPLLGYLVVSLWRGEE